VVIDGVSVANNAVYSFETTLEITSAYHLVEAEFEPYF